MIYGNLDKMIAEAMKSNNQETLKVLRLVKSDLQKALIANKGKLDELGETKVLMSMVEQREKDIAIYREAGRTDLEDEEQKELDIIRSYIPKQPTEEEITVCANKAIDSFLASKDDGYTLSVKDTKPIMDIVKETYNTPTVGKIVSAVLKSKLA